MRPLVFVRAHRVIKPPRSLRRGALSPPQHQYSARPGAAPPLPLKQNIWGNLGLVRRSLEWVVNPSPFERGAGWWRVGVRPWSGGKFLTPGQWFLRLRSCHRRAGGGTVNSSSGPPGWWNGRHEGLRSLYRKMCRFDSCPGHQKTDALFSGGSCFPAVKPVGIFLLKETGGHPPETGFSLMGVTF